MPRTPRLSRAEVINGACAIADEQGLAAVTMSAVASRLGATPMALYHHVEGKEHLLDLLIAAVLSEVPDVDETVALAERLGGKVLAPAEDIPDVGRFAVLQDPQGGVFAVLTSAMPLGPEEDPAPRTFSWHELTTSDQQAAIRFYEQLFGWVKQSEFDMGNMGVYHMFGRDRFTYGGMMAKPPEAPGTYWLHYIQVADSADAATTRATALGAKAIVGPMEVPGGDRVAVLTDPQGAFFAVHSKGAK